MHKCNQVTGSYLFIAAKHSRGRLTPLYDRWPTVTSHDRSDGAIWDIWGELKKCVSARTQCWTRLFVMIIVTTFPMTRDSTTTDPNPTTTDPIQRQRIQTQFWQCQDFGCISTPMPHGLSATSLPWKQVQTEALILFLSIADIEGMTKWNWMNVFLDYSWITYRLLLIMIKLTDNLALTAWMYLLGSHLDF